MRDSLAIPSGEREEGRSWQGCPCSPRMEKSCGEVVLDIHSAGCEVPHITARENGLKEDAALGKDPALK